MHLKTALCTIAGITIIAALGLAQPPGGRGFRRDGSPPGVESFLNRLFAFDANGDQKLTKDELTDKRLGPLFERADANRDGVLTKDELTKLFEKESAALGSERGGGQPDEPGGPPGFGGPGGPGGFGGPPRPGEILPPFLRDRLELNERQIDQLDKLQREVDSRLAQILTAEQRRQLDELRTQRLGGPPGFGPPGSGRPNRAPLEGSDDRP